VIDAELYIDGVLAGDRTMLARAITLVESNARKHAHVAEKVIHAIQPHSGRSIRIGITGVPGVGKSTFIEALGCRLCDEGKKVAVLAVDPSSSVTHGSILGDKTRMEELGQRSNAFIRPSPAGGTLGGVTRKSRETILLCEAAGFEVVIVETVGVGQSETTVRSMVDFFLVLMLAGAGDELQGIKKGIIELADALVVTKADGENKIRAEAARVELSRVLHFLTPISPEWKPVVRTCSSVEQNGIAEVWKIVEDFCEIGRKSGSLQRRRRNQVIGWMYELLQQELWRTFEANPEVNEALQDIEREVLESRLSPAAAVRRLLDLGTRSRDGAPW
jgi:LAO/AO transport system kinase